MNDSTPKKIRLGICMAGAVSAGAYTAGVVDYMIETLERWEQKKKSIIAKKEKGEALTDEELLVPMHEVVVEVLSGASAGGMTAAVLAYSFNDDTFINKRNGKIIDGDYNLPAETDTPTKLYNSWINMVDEKDSSTFKKLMDPSDVGSIETMRSLLNSKPIDDIAANAIPPQINFTPPNYISKHLSVILSVTNLEGIPVDIRFSNIEESNPTCNVLRMHSGFLHYQFNEQSVNIDFPPEIITNNSRDHLAVAAKATGAFPFGLANRRITVNHIYFEAFKKQLKQNYNLNVNLELPAGANYVFNAVDGGAINNEPIGTTVKVLESKKKLYNPGEENYMILIDPFPSVTNTLQKSVYADPGEYNLLQQAFKIFSAFKNQSAFKQEDLLNGLEMDDNRYLIYPAKRKFYFLASGLIGGFGGFLKKAFRSHDYQLGRKNCQAFLRFYFGEKIEKFETITNIVLTDKQKEKWRYNINYGKPDKPEIWKMPFIPDMLLLDRSYSEIEVPVYNGISTKEMNEVTGQISVRLKAVVDKSYPLLQKKGKGINSILGLAMKWFPRFFKNKISGVATKKTREYLENAFFPQSLKQDVLLTKFADSIQKEGNIFQKITGAGITTNDTSPIVALQITEKNILRCNLEGLEKLIPGQQAISIETAKSENQLLRLNDYLVFAYAKNEVYRISRIEFEATYREVH